jgi:hypothetical protein
MEKCWVIGTEQVGGEPRESVYGTLENKEYQWGESDKRQQIS